jgi:hypothetical protein
MALSRGRSFGGLDELVADHVSVRAQRDRGVHVAEPGCDRMHGDASQQQGCRINAAKVVNDHSVPNG